MFKIDWSNGPTLLRANGGFVRLDPEADADQPEIVAQRVQLELATHLGEWDYDARRGVPWLTLTQVQTSDTVRRGSISSVILSVPGVLSIEDLAITVDPATRVLTYTGTIRASKGLATISGEV